jgi:hypothetical protein
LSFKKIKIRIPFGNLYVGSTVQYLPKYSNRYRQGGEKEEKPRPDTRKTVTKTNKRQEPEAGGQRDRR